MSNSTETQTAPENQHELVTVRTVRDSIFPEDECLTNCRICGDPMLPSASGLCESCAGSSSLAALNDRLLAEPDGDLSEALAIANGASLMLPEKRHLVALVAQLERSDRYERTLERCIAQAQRNADRATEGLHNAAMLYAESEAIH